MKRKKGKENKRGSDRKRAVAPCYMQAELIGITEKK
jgi:hypothetical protein